jgi:autotransporter passenger strand-loop-strand repeat protein
LTLTVEDVIADQSGSDTTNLYNDPGAGALVVGTGESTGRLVLAPQSAGAAVDNSFVGGITLKSGELELASRYAAGAGVISFAPSAAEATLLIDPADQNAGGTQKTALADFDAAKDVIDLVGLQLSAGASATDNGSILTITDGAKVIKFVLETSSAHTEYLYADGHGGVIVTDNATYTRFVVSSGVTSVGKVLPTGYVEQVLSGGAASATHVSSGGRVYVSSGASSEGDIISSGGAEELLSGASVGDATVSAGGVLSGAGAVKGLLTVAAGGRIYSFNATSGAEIVLDAAATASGVGVASGGTLEIVHQVMSGATLTVGPISAVEIVDGVALSSGAHLATLSAAVLAGGLEIVASGAVASSTTISAGGEMTLQSGASIGRATVSSSGSLVVSRGAAATLSVVAGGATLDYGLTRDDVISAGVETVEALGLASAITVSGGSLTVLSGGVASGASVLAGGVEVVSSGGVARSATVAGGRAYVYGTASGTSVSSGGVEYVFGAASNAVAASGGSEVVRSGGLATLTRILSGGQQAISSGGAASFTTVSSGGADYVYSGGVASATTLSNGGVERILSGGREVGATLSSGGRVFVSKGAAAVGATVSAGGDLYVLASGRTTGTVIGNGGKQLISSGGVALGTQVLSGGAAYVYSGGADETVTISSGGEEIISLGGGVVGVSLIAGGKLVDNGEIRFGGAGTLAGTLSGSGLLVQGAAGDLVLSDLGTPFTGKALISGGTIELARAGALGTGSVQFAAPTTGSAVLQIDAAAAPAAGGTFANTISNFSAPGEDIDLRSIAFVSGASATIVGSTLVLTDGGKTYAFNLAGSNAGAYPATSDGHGGTLIGPKLNAFVQAAAVFAPSVAGRMVLASGAALAAETPFARPSGSTGLSPV